MSSLTLSALASRCINEHDLKVWLYHFLNFTIPTRRVCPGHSSPYDYLAASYFEPAQDLIVWAPRGGGKTKLGAVATLLDLLHKPSVQVRILGGSLDQSQRMWEHLLPTLDPYLDHAARAVLSRSLNLTNGSRCAILTQSQKSVRGLRVQKIRCDEVELFDPKVWEAAQLAIKSKTLDDHHHVRGSLEALSTLHLPYGLMAKIVDDAESRGSRIIKWCLLEVLQQCPPDRPCQGCPLWDECQGRAKSWQGGYVSIDDAITMKHRVSKETWEAEMLCRRPSHKGAVFPTFDPAVHVAEHLPTLATGRDVTLALDFGFAAPFVCLWIRRDDAGRTYVIDEYVQPGRTIAEHLPHLEARPWGARKMIACDPAGTATSDQTARSNVQYLKSQGYTVRFSKSLIIDGLEMIRAALRPAYGDAKLFIHPRCPQLIAALKGYRYPDTPSELPLKDGTHDHLIDALRYHFVNAPRLHDPQPPKSY